MLYEQEYMYILHVENNKRVTHIHTYELAGSNLSTFSCTCECIHNYFAGPLILSNEVRTPARVTRGDIHSLLANGFHNDMPRGKLGHLIILEGPPLARVTLSRPWNDPTSLLETHA